MKNLLPYACLILLLLPNCTKHRSTEETLTQPVQVVHQRDFDGNGAPDQFILSWKTVKDFAVDHDGTRTADQKIEWYQVSLKIVSARGQTLLDDTYSFQAGEFEHDIIGPTGLPAVLTPTQYFEQYFTFPPKDGWAPFQQTRRRITADEIDRDAIARLIKAYHSTATPEAVEMELLAGEHDVITYERTWYEDIGVITYSKTLGRAVYLTSQI